MGRILPVDSVRIRAPFYLLRISCEDGCGSVATLLIFGVEAQGISASTEGKDRAGGYRV